MNLEIPRGTPPQLRLLLIRLMEAEESQVLDAVLQALEHLLRFFTGLSLQNLQNEGTCLPKDLRAMREKTGTVEGCEKVFKSCVDSLGTRSRTWRSEQLLELFFGGIERPEDRALSRWLKLGGAPHPAPLLSQSPTDPAPLLDLLRDWLKDATSIFSEEVWTLDREVATVAGSGRSARPKKPVPVPRDPLAVSQQDLVPVVESWAAMVLHPPLPLDDDALMDLLKHFLLAIETRARGHLYRNDFEAAERDFAMLSGFAHGARGRHPLAPILASAMAGRGRARSCLGRFPEAERDLEVALRIHRELLNRDPTPEGAAALAWSLLYRALNRRCEGNAEEALSDLDLAAQFADLAPDEKVLHRALQQERLQGNIPQMNEQIKDLKTSTDPGEQLELVSSLIERSFRIDPALKDSRATSDRKAAITLLNRLRKADPALTLKAIRNRPCRWGRSRHDLAIWEMDLRFLRFTYEQFLTDPDFEPSLRDALELTEGLLQNDFLPEKFVRELLSLFTELANSGKKGYDPGWQGEHWLHLRELFEARGKMEYGVRCMVLEGVARQDTPERVIRILDRLGQVLARNPVMNGLEPLGSSFRSLRAIQRQHPELRRDIQEMANRWRKLPLVIPARAGADRPLLAALAEEEFVC